MNKLKTIVKRYWPNLLALLVCGIITGISILMINLPTGFVSKKTALKMGIITILLLFLAFKFVQSLTNHYWYSLAIISSIYLIFLIANIIKIKLRDEPILPFDFAMITNLPAIIKMISPLYLAFTIIFITVLFIACFYLSKHRPVNKLNFSHRLTYLIIAIVIFGSTSFWNHTSTIFPNVNATIGNDPTFWDQAQGAKNNGILIQFLNNIDVQIMPKPKNYSKTKIQEITNKYQKIAQEINKHRKNKISTQTVIFNLSEAFADPRRVPHIKLSKNPIPRIDNIKKKTTSGLMMSSNYGGGTANMEYMSLTGFATCNFEPTMSSPYTQLVPRQSSVSTFNQSFHYSAGIHPYSGEFYNRIPNYKKFKFNKFEYIGNQKYPIKHLHKIDKNTYESDQTAYANLLDQLHSHKKSQFINLITIQNHYPYSNLYYKNKIHTISTNHSDNSTITTFATGLNYSDIAVNRAIEKINNIPRPITLIFYGDHLPAAGYANNMQKDGIKLHETDYFIFSNKAAKKEGARNLKHDAYVSPSNFIAMTLQQTNSKVTPYQALLTKIYQNIPAFSIDSTGKSTNAQFINNRGQEVLLNKHQKKLWHDYLLIQYDLTAGKNYSKSEKFMKSIISERRK